MPRRRRLASLETLPLLLGCVWRCVGLSSSFPTGTCCQPMYSRSHTFAHALTFPLNCRLANRDRKGHKERNRQRAGRATTTMGLAAAFDRRCRRRLLLLPASLLLLLVLALLLQPAAAFSFLLRSASLAPSHRSSKLGRTGKIIYGAVVVRSECCVIAHCWTCSGLLFHAHTAAAAASSSGGALPWGEQQQEQQWQQRAVKAIRLAASASTSSSSAAEAGAGALPEVVASKAPSFLKVLWRFTRPHTFIGTALCIPALTLYAAPSGPALLHPRVLGSILWALLPSGLINVYITGLNQVRIQTDTYGCIMNPHTILYYRSGALTCSTNPLKSGDGRGDRQDQQALPPHRRRPDLQGESLTHSLKPLSSKSQSLIDSLCPRHSRIPAHTSKTPLVGVVLLLSNICRWRRPWWCWPLCWRVWGWASSLPPSPPRPSSGSCSGNNHVRGLSGLRGDTARHAQQRISHVCIRLVGSTGLYLIIMTALWPWARRTRCRPSASSASPCWPPSASSPCAAPWYVPTHLRKQGNATAQDSTGQGRAGQDRTGQACVSCRPTSNPLCHSFFPHAPCGYANERPPARPRSTWASTATPCTRRLGSPRRRGGVRCWPRCSRTPSAWPPPSSLPSLAPSSP
jgi:hypothetical protein